MSTPVDAVLGSGASSGEPPAVVPSPRRRRFSRGVREAGLGYLLLLPAFLIFAVFIFYPFFRNFYLGFFSTPPFPGQPGWRRRSLSSRKRRHPAGHPQSAENRKRSEPDKQPLPKPSAKES